MNTEYTKRPSRIVSRSSGPFREYIALAPPTSSFIFIFFRYIPLLTMQGLVAYPHLLTLTRLGAASSLHIWDYIMPKSRLA